MHKKNFLTLIVIIGVVAFYFIFDGNSNISNKKEKETNFVEKIKVVHMFVGDMHTFTGEINLPTPCHILSSKVFIAESYPEQITIAFDRTTEADLCAQIITPEPFTVSFEASKEAVIKMTLDGKDLSFETTELEAPKSEDTPDILGDKDGSSSAESVLEFEKNIIDE